MSPFHGQGPQHSMFGLLLWLCESASPVQGVIFPAGVRVFPAGNLQNSQEILTKTLIIEQML